MGIKGGEVSLGDGCAKTVIIITACCQDYLSGQVSCLSDSNEVWSDKLSVQKRREPEGVCLVERESDHDVRSIMCMV